MRFLYHVIGIECSGLRMEACVRIPLLTNRIFFLNKLSHFFSLNLSLFLAITNAVLLIGEHFFNSCFGIWGHISPIFKDILLVNEYFTKGLGSILIELQIFYISLCVARVAERSKAPDSR